MPTHLDRRAHPRLTYHTSSQFIANPSFPLRTKKALTQDISLRGAQLLTREIPDTKRPFNVWIPLDGDDIICAKANVVWITIEDQLGDSPYWVRVGVHWSFDDSSARESTLKALAKKIDQDRLRVQQDVTKVGFIF